MSASTVSVTANPRRRPSTVSDVKQTVDILNKNDAVNGGNDNLLSVEKDTSHSTRGEIILERSKDKKNSSQLPNSNRARNRKPVPPPQKPRWRTVVSVLTKNLLLLVVLVVFVQVLRNLLLNSGGSGGSGGSGSLLGFSDMEGRISRVESSFKTTVKMLQVQVEVVDKKIESEVGNLRREVSKRIEDKSEEIGKKLVKLEKKSENLEMGLVELRSKEVLTKDDLVKLYDELKKSEGNGGNLGFNLDEIRGLAREIVEKEIEKHAADGLGRVDFALGASGAKVVGHSEPLSGFGSWSLAISKNRVQNDASKMLMPSFGEPGQCFALKGSSGYVVIRLRAAIVPEAITLEHVAESVAYDRSSAPKHCRVSGLLARDQSLEALDNLEKFILTDFVYDLEKSHAQTFDVRDEVKSSVIDTVLFEFSSNYGSSTHTCIYRLRVHGHEPKSLPVVPSNS